MAKPEHETHKGTQAGSAGPSFGSGIGSTNDPFGMAEWLKDMPKVPLHPLMQHPAAAFAAATAVGLGMTSHIAGFMLGAMQGMAETAQKTGAALDEKPVAQPAEPMAGAAAAASPAKASVEAKPVRVEPEKAKPVKAEPVRAEKPKRQRVARVVETQADDLKRISGIGPKLEQVLNGMGVRRYADVASWSDKDAQRFDAQLGFGGRIARDGWVEQAKALMKG
ncbi:NADH:ubiquinone oxidoreductase [Rhizobium herbae]|uniref:NADH-quinone oxidoreductase subunit E n=1 Tax=Rhizobium herbae TaxID=508661 RepID=A0ABS4ESG2_9HYPH|nr:NADH:ubiquinone oxidoreductase [Rhizobium herbae]MBP1860890.1 NADH-quinone oxidoreductase subunit E [Rhizobium herbae]